MKEKTEVKIYKQLIDFQKIVPSIGRNTKNGYLNSWYASLPHIQSVIKESLITSGLCYKQIIDGKGVRTVVFNEEGETIEAFYPINFDKKPQDVGSIISYAKRYMLVSLLGLIVDDESDDDANKAQNQNQVHKPKRATPRQKAILKKIIEKDFFSEEQKDKMQKLLKNGVAEKDVLEWTVGYGRKYLEDVKSENSDFAENIEINKLDYDNVIIWLGNAKKHLELGKTEQVN